MLRDRLLDQPFYRLIHAEADGLPGLIVDRYGDVCVAQLNTAGMDRLAGQIVEALQSALKPTGIVLQRDGNARRLEGLDDAPAEIIGDLQSHGTEVVESEDLAGSIADADVIYMSRIRKERFPDEDEYVRVAGIYKLVANDLSSVKKAFPFIFSNK